MLRGIPDHRDRDGVVRDRRDPPHPHEVSKCPSFIRDTKSRLRSRRRLLHRTSSSACHPLTCPTRKPILGHNGFSIPASEARASTMALLYRYEEPQPSPDDDPPSRRSPGNDLECDGEGITYLGRRNSGTVRVGARPRTPGPRHCRQTERIRPVNTELSPNGNH